jgi:Protein of unknown function (DUF5672)
MRNLHPNRRPLTGKSVAVVVPQHRFPLTEEEGVSLRHLRRHLGGFDKYLIGPDALPAAMADFRLRRFPHDYFASPNGYNRLLMTREFYRAFAAYEYILVYQLDCLVFSGDLEHWCRKGWDYVGAPWFHEWKNDPTGGFWIVGNGGLSLRNVAGCMAVLNSPRPFRDPEARGKETRLFPSSPRLRALVCRVKKEFHRRGYKNSVRWRIRQLGEHAGIHEDMFWSLDARVFRPEFRIPEPREALPFSFEMAPRYCFKENGERLPFGCHAWAKYDRAFWEPYLLRP